MKVLALFSTQNSGDWLVYSVELLDHDGAPVLQDGGISYAQFLRSVASDFEVEIELHRISPDNVSGRHTRHLGYALAVRSAADYTRLMEEVDACSFIRRHSGDRAMCQYITKRRIELGLDLPFEERKRRQAEASVRDPLRDAYAQALRAAYAARGTADEEATRKAVQEAGEAIEAARAAKQGRPAPRRADPQATPRSPKAQASLQALRDAYAARLANEQPEARR